MNKDKSHKPMSASSIYKSFSNNPATRQKSKEKLSKTSSLPLNVTEGAQTNSEDYSFINHLQLNTI